MSLFSNEVLGDGTKAVSKLFPTGAKLITTKTVTVPLVAATTSGTIFIAEDGYTIVSASVAFGTTSTSGTVNLETRGNGTAIGSGTAVLTSALALHGTTNTVVSAAPTSVTTGKVAIGQQLGIVIAGTMTSLANGSLTVVMTRN